MDKKIKEIRTVADSNTQDFDKKANEAIKDGFKPWGPCIPVDKPGYFDQGSRIHHSGYTIYTQQFVKYEE